MKKIIAICLLAGLVSSCSTVKEGIEDNIEHYKRLTRDHNIREIDYTKHNTTLEGARFLVANHPDQTIFLDGTNFDERYKKLVNYLENSGYTVVVNEKLPLTATIIAELNKPVPDLKYVGVAMEQHTRMQQTEYNIAYGGNEYKARELYNNYKKTL